MRRRNVRFPVALAGVALLVGLPTLPAGASPALAAKSTPPVTCAQLTKKQIQPLLTEKIATKKVTLEFSTADPLGQQCVWTGPDGAGTIDVVVLKGKQYFTQDVSQSHLNVPVPGVGDKAFRAKGDFQIDALKGNVFCSVTTGSGGDIPGVGALETAAGGTSNIPEKDNTIVAKALGTICNRVFKKGSTTPSLAGL